MARIDDETLAQWIKIRARRHEAADRVCSDAGVPARMAVVVRSTHKPIVVRSTQSVG